MSTKPKRIKKKSFQTVRGMRDILPEEQMYWEKIKQVVKKSAETYGFGKIETPILEDVDLFAKGTGAFTDIVEKEMFILKTKGGDRLCLRPEFTPAVIRAYLEDGLSSLPRPVKLYSVGPIFRYERPQKGRYRQSYQANFEIIGEKDPVLDAQLIQMFFSISANLGLKKLVTRINSIGCPQCRLSYKRELLKFYRKIRKSLCPDCQRRLQNNPLRLLDCKNSKCVQLSEDAPQIIDFLCDECHNHFKNVLEYLDELEIPYILDSRLARGLDYYTKTVFEIWPEDEDGRQLALAGGGRYDGLVKLLGGRDTPAAGFALGLDRIIGLMKGEKVKVPSRACSEVFLVQLGELGKKKSLKLFEKLQKAGIRTTTSFNRDKMTSQLKIANKLKARFALILGQKEALDETIIIRDMISGTQETVPIEKIVKILKRKLKNKLIVKRLS
ncbi:MAG: histidine--tRNA ligase [Patescibacteria group bacterium]|nr:histidine--tRNA ligase [Patescibacteria group bacterium]